MNVSSKIKYIFKLILLGTFTSKIVTIKKANEKYFSQNFDVSTKFILPFKVATFIYGFCFLFQISHVRSI